MPNRILKESINTSETIDQLDWPEEVLFYRLITVCDDYGRFDGRASIIRGRCFPLRLDRVSEEDVERWLQKLASVDLIRLYVVDGRRYLQMTTWRKHQRVRAAASKYPEMPAGAVKQEQVQSSDDIRCQLTSDDSNGRQMSPIYEYDIRNTTTTTSTVQSGQSTAEDDGENGNRGSSGSGRNSQDTTTDHVVGSEQEKQKVLDFFNSSSFILLPSPFQLESLTNWVDQGFSGDAVCYAMELAMKADKRGDIRYVEGILRKWLNAGVHTRQEAEAFQERRLGELARSRDAPGDSRRTKTIVLDEEDLAKRDRILREIQQLARAKTVPEG